VPAGTVAGIDLAAAPFDDGVLVADASAELLEPQPESAAASAHATITTALVRRPRGKTRVETSERMTTFRSARARAKTNARHIGCRVIEQTRRRGVQMELGMLTPERGTPSNNVNDTPQSRCVKSGIAGKRVSPGQ
jgi:hypothetical protein